MQPAADRRSDPPAPAASGACVAVASRRFGSFEVPLERVITLEGGLLGFPGARRHALLDHRPGSPFKWLLCIDEPELGFAVADPRDFVPGWEAPLERAAAVLGCAPHDVAAFVLVTIPPAPTEIHLNLLAPVVVDLRTRRGCQLVLDDPALDPAHRVPLVRPGGDAGAGVRAAR